MARPLLRLHLLLGYEFFFLFVLLRPNTVAAPAPVYTSLNRDTTIDASPDAAEDAHVLIGARPSLRRLTSPLPLYTSSP